MKKLLKAIVVDCTVTNRFSNGFDVDFTLQGETTVFHGRLYENNSDSYKMAVFMDKEFYKYSKEPNSANVDDIANQILNILKGEI